MPELTEIQETAVPVASTSAAEAEPKLEDVSDTESEDTIPELEDAGKNRFFKTRNQ